MKISSFLLFIAFTLIIPAILKAQSPVPDSLRDSILLTGKALATINQASQSSTQLVASRYKLQGLSGFITYRRNQTWTTAFYSSRNDSFTIHYTVTLGPNLSTVNAVVSNQERNPTAYELPYIIVREAVIKDISYDENFYSFYEKTRFNIAFMEKRNSFNAFIFTVGNDEEVILLGNDYLLDISKEGKLLSRQKLHENLMHIPVKSQEKGAALGSMHLHEGKESIYISPTDIATIIMNKDRIEWEKHMVMSEKYISVFYLDDETLAITPVSTPGKSIRKP